MSSSPRSPSLRSTNLTKSSGQLGAPSASLGQSIHSSSSRTESRYWHSFALSSPEVADRPPSSVRSARWYRYSATQCVSPIRSTPTCAFIVASRGSCAQARPNQRRLAFLCRSVSSSITSTRSSTSFFALLSPFLRLSLVCRCPTSSPCFRGIRLRSTVASAGSRRHRAVKHACRAAAAPPRRTTLRVRHRQRAARGCRYSSPCSGQSLMAVASGSACPCRAWI